MTELGRHEFTPNNRGRRKVTVIGAGAVGATAAQEIARRDYADVFSTTQPRIVASEGPAPKVDPETTWTPNPK